MLRRSHGDTQFSAKERQELARLEARIESDIWTIEQSRRDLNEPRRACRTFAGDDATSAAATRRLDENLDLVNAPAAAAQSDGPQLTATSRPPHELSR